MSDTNGIIEKINSQRSVLDSLRPISVDNMVKIRRKFQLEFNYHSNHIEGNSLTLQETYSMILNSYSPRESKPLRDIDELRGHIKTVDSLGLLEDVVKDKKNITETLIRDLNKMILVENFKKRRQDKNGDGVFVDIIVGQYKTRPNSVLTQTGEMFRFADPSETPALMHDLIEWYDQNQDTLHPLELAAIFHYKFIRIHPFDDGNGRVARLLMNLILQNNSFPIVIIQSDDKQKEEYYRALMLTDANLIDLYTAVQSQNTDLFEPFITFIGQKLLQSLDWTIRGAQGEDIFEIDDIVKEAKLYNKDLKFNKNSIPTLEEIRDEDLFSFMLDFEDIFSYFDQLLVNYLNPYYKSVTLEFLYDGRMVKNKIQEVFNTKNYSINIHDYKNIITDEFVADFVGEVVYNLNENKLGDTFLSNVNSPHTVQINITPVESYQNKNINTLKVKMQFNKAKWRIVLISDDFYSVSNILYYSYNDNSFKEAIREPLQKLSEYLKNKLQS